MAPSGLDGNPDPIRTPARDAVLDEVASLVRAIPALVGIDGHSSVGTSTFADELAARLDGACRSTTDSFHNPRAVRLPPNVDPAESYVSLSHDLNRLRWYVLDPFRAGDGRPWRAAAFDEPSNSPVDAPEEPVPADGVLLFDGLFLHRPELAPYWDLTVLLVAPSRAPTEGHRYVDGWRLYLERCRPEERATIVIDNDDLAAPSIVRRPGP